MFFCKKSENNTSRDASMAAPRSCRAQEHMNIVNCADIAILAVSVLLCLLAVINIGIIITVIIISGIIIMHMNMRTKKAN